ncbi:MAG: hypothetical protein MJY78_06760 [Fibrobacter sp.]|nr:hypothetical protein [Fibrobacter sp.]
MMNRICGLFAGTMLAFVCGGMLAGCSDLNREWGPVEWSEYRDGEKVVGFIDDSLVIVSDWRSWSQEQEGYVTDGGTRGGRGHTRLRVFNYRVQEDGPRWTDSLDNDYYEYARGQVADSIIWGSESGSISFWKLGEKPFVVEYVVQKKGCQEVFQVNRLRIWNDGLFFVQGPLNADGDSCQYAVLDTTKKTLTYKRLDNDLEWIRKCDDVRAWGEDVYCFMPGDHAFEAVLLRNGKDTIDVPVKFTVGDFWGDVLLPNANLCNLINGQVVCSGAIWRGGLSFYQNDEIVVELE